jgi:SAM-dependent methyltransferase
MANEPLPLRAAAEARAYDALYTDDAVEARHDKRYHRLFRRVADIAVAKGVPSVLEIGSGSGAQARMLIAEGIVYRGFDFNAHAVERARRRNGSEKHFMGDATDPAAYAVPYDAIVCCEVLEHIDNDLQAIELWRPGSLCICSVPNFDDETHVRLFRHEREVRERYGHLIDIDWIERRPAAPIAGSTPREYLRRLLWSRDNPRKFLGLLGVNRFEWIGGWFVFVGTRR